MDTSLPENLYKKPVTKRRTHAYARRGGYESGMNDQPAEPYIHEVPIRYHPRLATEHLGKRKYTTTAKALAELISNSLDAKAGVIRVDLYGGEVGKVLGRVESIVVRDDGEGMTRAVVEERFAYVGVERAAGQSSDRTGQFGIGRLAVYRIGSMSRWTTTAKDAAGALRTIEFTLRSDETADKLRFKETLAPAGTPTGTMVEIFNVCDATSQALLPAHLRDDLLAHFCARLLARPDREVWVDGERLRPDILILSSEDDTIEAGSRDGVPTTIKHLILRKPIERAGFEGPVAFTFGGQLVKALGASDVRDIAGPNYVALVESPSFKAIVTSNREGLAEWDGEFRQVLDAALDRVASFGATYRQAQQSRFIDRARNQPFYPYRGGPRDMITETERAAYDFVLEKVNETANIDALPTKQQALIFRLLRRAIESDDLVRVLADVIELDDDQMRQFRKVVERVKLSSLIQLANTVSARIEFLDFLHSLCYSDLAKGVKERSQLHKIIEGQAWIFDPDFYLSRSDRGMREVIRTHRATAGLDPSPDVEPEHVHGLDDIPDLFLMSDRQTTTAPRHRRLVVELKRPTVKIGFKEFEQINKYRATLQSCSDFDQADTIWDIYVVSSHVKDDLDGMRKQEGQPLGLVTPYKNTRLWIFEWGEIIDRARTELRIVREHLLAASDDMAFADHLREFCPALVGKMGPDQPT